MLVKSKNGEVVGNYEVVLVEVDPRMPGEYLIMGYTASGQKVQINRYATLEAAKADLDQIYQALSKHQGGVHFGDPKEVLSDEKN